MMSTTPDMIIKISGVYKPKLHTEFVDKYTKCMKPAHTALKVLGLLPVNLSDSGQSNNRIISKHLFYSFFVYTVLAINAYFGFTPLIYRDHSESAETFKQRISLFETVTSLIFILAVPIAMWYESRKLPELANKWKTFQCMLERLAKSSVDIYDHWMPIILSLIVLFIPLVPLAISSALTFHNCVIQSISMFVCDTYLNMMLSSLCLYWYLRFHILCSATQELLYRLKMEIMVSSNIDKTIGKYRSLWIHLSGVTRQMSDTFGYTYCCYIMYDFANLAKQIYLLLLFVSLNELSYVVWSASLIVVQASIIIVMCNSGQKVHNTVCTKFKEELLRLGLLENHAANCEIKLFVKTIDTFSPEVNLQGLVAINRKTLTTLCGLLLTYLIVLVQFDKRLV